MTYARYGNNLAGALRQAFGVETTAIATEGGPDNLRRLQEGHCDLGFTQADTYKAMKSNAQILGTLGTECGFVAVNADGKVGETDDFESEKLSPVLSVGGQGSGAAVSWAYFVQLDDEFAATQLDYTGGAQAIARTLSGQSDAVLIFTDPTKIAQTILGKAVSENDELEWIDFVDSDFNDKLPDGSAVYKFEKVEVPGQWSDVKVPCTPLLVVGRETLNPKVAEAVSTLLLTNKKGVTR